MPSERKQAIQPAQKQTEIALLVFNIGSKDLSVAVETTEGVVDCPRISPLPGAPDEIIGVSSIRGRITLVVDLSGDALDSQSSPRRRLILLKGDSQVGLLADRIEGVRTFKSKHLRNASNALRKRGEPKSESGMDRAQQFCRKRVTIDGRSVLVLEPELIAGS